MQVQNDVIMCTTDVHMCIYCAHIWYAQVQILCKTYEHVNIDIVHKDTTSLDMYTIDKHILQ